VPSTQRDALFDVPLTVSTPSAVNLYGMSK
jgi:hypothetical protein